VSILDGKHDGIQITFHFPVLHTYVLTSIQLFAMLDISFCSVITSILKNNGVTDGDRGANPGQTKFKNRDST